VTVTARRLIVVVALGVAVIAGLSIASDLGELGDRLGGFGWAAFAAALALAAFNYAVRFARWQLYLRGQGLAVATGTSALVFLSGFALSITPGKVGELIKSYLLRHTDGVPVATSAPLVIAERVTDLIGLLLLGLAGVLAYGVATGMVLAGFAAVALGLVALAWPALGHRVIDLVTRPRRLARLGDRLRELHRNLAGLLRPWPLGWATALAVVAWLAECIGFALIVAAFPGTAVPLGLAISIYAITTVAGALSFLPGGLLVTEAAMIAMLVQSSGGVDQPTATAATILTRLATLWFAVALGVIALAVLRRHRPAAGAALEPSEPGSGAGTGMG
jgi:glycosyltransferase 2 family protein